MAAGRGGGTGKMDEEQNKMARTPGTGSRLRQVPGSKPGPRAQPDPTTTASWSVGQKKCVQGMRAGTTGKSRQMGRSREEQAGWLAGVGKARERRVRRKPQKSGALMEG